MEILSSEDWGTLGRSASGADSATSVSDGVLTVTKSQGVGFAVYNKRFLLMSGDELEVEVLARRVSGSDTTSGGTSMYWPTDTPLVNEVKVTSDEWRKYTLSYTARIGGDDNSAVRVAFGMGTTAGGAVQFKKPVFRVKGSMGTARSMLMGCIKIASGVAQVYPNFVTVGISSVSYDADGRLRIYLKNTLPAGQRPITVATMGASSIESRPLMLKGGDHDNTKNCLTFAFYNSSGTLVNVSTLGDIYLNVMMFGV